MVDLTKAVQARSDQLNNIDLITKPEIIKITAVKHGTDEQKLTINYDGDNGKPWKPCVTMIRLLIEVWDTNDGDDFVGRSVMLYRDPDVKFGPISPGGIRVSHVSDIESQKKVTLPVSRGRFATFVVDPLVEKPKNELTDEAFEYLSKQMDEAGTMADLKGVADKIADGNYDKAGTAKLKAEYSKASKRIRELSK